MELNELVAELESRLQNPQQGLPDDVFRFLTRITPMINVDLLIKDDAGRVLLTWREDALHAPGWHVPGGIIRFKETAAARIDAVASVELGATVVFEDRPIAFNQIITPGRDTRGHFISLLYDCSLTSEPDSTLRFFDGEPEAGQWAWHQGCPDNLLSVHDIYRQHIENH
jgi:colanic acid biosynthesis protein WcaH